MTSVQVASSPTGGYYSAGDTIRFTVTFNQYVTAQGGPQFEFELGGATRQAAGGDSEEEMNVTFEYTVAAGDADDRDGISWGANALSLNGGSITLSGKGVLIPRDANRDHAAQGALSAHKVDTTKPTLVEAVVDQTALSLTFSEELNTTAPANTAFTVKVDGGSGANPTPVSISGRVVTLTLGTAVIPGQTVTVSYAKPTANRLKDLSGKEADAFDDEAVRTAPAVEVTATFGRNSYTAAEGATESVTVSLSENPLRRVIIPITRLEQGGAGSADYSFPESVTFVSGETLKTLTFSATQDQADDDGESVRFGFGALPTGVSPGPRPQTTVNIADDDDPEVRVSFAQGSYEVAEGGAAAIAVNLNADPQRELVIPIVVTEQGGATSTDYGGVPGSVTFASDQTSITFTFSATQDTDNDDGESVRLAFGTLPDSRVSAGTPDEATVSITDDDRPPPPLNRSPRFTEGASTSRSVPENTSAGASIGGPIAARDPNGDTLTYSLGGTDLASFAIVASSGQLQTRAALDFETRNTYAVTVSVRDGKNSAGNPDSGTDDTIGVSINVTDVNEARTRNTTRRRGGGGGGGVGGGGGFVSVQPPVFTGGARITLTIPENSPAGANVGRPVTAADPNNLVLTYSLGGSDAGFFTIDRATAQIRVGAGTTLDYRARKNTYTVVVTARNVFAATAATRVTITVTSAELGTLGSRYDADNNGVVEPEEVLAAIVDYFGGRISLEGVLEVVTLYFSD